MAEKYKSAIRPHQGFQEKFVRSNIDVVIGGGQLAGGKQMPDYQPVMTPNGWVRHGDLKVGDMVCTPFNGYTRVLGVFPQGVKQCYSITFSDGRTCEAGLEHLWEVRTYKQIRKCRKKGRNENFYVWTTKQIMEYMENMGDMYIPIPHAQELPEKDLVVPPYVLGVMIGDGCLTESSWQVDTCFKVSNNEYDIIRKLSSIVNAKRIYKQRGSCTHTIYTDEAKKYKKYIEDVGLNTYSYNKFIPKEYLWGSIEQRKELLYGLMDTDGCVEEGNSFSFSTTSERLKNDFIYLCRSLGYITSVYEDRRDKYTSGVAYDIIIHTDDIIFSSDKHLSRYQDNYERRIKNRKYARGNDHIKIVSIKKTKKTSCTCILVEDSDHLYITKDFITTHNTYGSILSVAEPSLDPKFRAVFLRNNLGDLRASGGILDDFKNCYNMGVRVIESGEPHADFPSGARVDITHVSDQNKKVLEKRFKGRQYDLIYFDEMTGFSWECFSFMFSRNRGKAAWTGKVRGTTNPKRSHWLRKFLDWYIGIDGEVIEEREGVVRYFYNAGESVEEVVWGDTKEEVYNKCKIQIDRFLRKFNGKKGHATYKDVIKSFTFYLGRTSENEELGAQYASSVAAMGGRNAEENSGNWNVDTDSDEDAPIPQEMANKVFTNDKCVNGDRWVTCDLADTGTDNLFMWAWDGFHMYDCKVVGHTTCRQNAEILHEFAAQHDVADDHIIYDAIRGTYINDYIEDAVQFVSYRAPIGLFGRNAQRLKDECYMRVVEAIKRGNLSMEESVALRIYEHQKLKGKERVTIQNEFLEECAVVRFMDMPSGKKRLMSKKEMNQRLGKGRSMDMLDPIAMRMLPVLEYPYGEELEKTAAIEEEDDDELDEYDDESVYSETLFS